MMKKRLIALAIAVSMVATMAGCSSNNQTNDATIELIEPVNAAVNSEKAAYRNLYDYKTISGYVYPYIEEYSFDIDVRLSEYEVIAGESVKKGDVLVHAYEGDLNKQIENMETAIENAKKAYDETIEQYDKDIQDLTDEINELIETRGVWYVVRSRIEDIPDNKPQFNHVDSQITAINRRIPSLELKIVQKQQKKDQTIELYELDSANRERLLVELKKNVDKYTIKSNCDGKIVSGCEISEGSYLSKGTEVIAVGDESQKIIRCEYVDKIYMAKCEDIYAIVNGKKYDVTYVPITAKEYERLQSQNGNVYSSFILDDPNGEINSGDLAVIVQIYSRKENVLTVPKGSIHKDNEGQYVYSIVDGNSVPTYIRTGVTDGVYTEVISGISEGADILVSTNIAHGDKKSTLGYRDFSNDFSGKGYITYPMVTTVKNELKYGTAYLESIDVMLYSHIDKGQQVATISVKGDDISLHEKEVDLQRQRERLDAAIEAENEYEIESRTKAIEELTKQIDEIKADINKTKIVADETGIVYWIEYIDEGSVLGNGAALVHIADENRCLIAIKDDRRQLVFGTTVNIAYKDENGNPCNATGMVVNAANTALSKRLVSEYAYIQVPKEAARNMPAITLINNMYYDRTKFDVTAQTRNMSNVLAIPRSAVKEINGKTYAFVVGSDGTVTAKSFIAGGYDNSYYWVVEGLEEGMIVCSE